MCCCLPILPNLTAAFAQPVNNSNSYCRFAGDSKEEISKGVNYTDLPHATSTLTLAVTREDNLREYR